MTEEEHTAYELAEVVTYDAALEAAVALLVQMNADARADVILITVGQYGSVQIVGAKYSAPNSETVIEGPAIIVYGKDARDAIDLENSRVRE